MLTKKSKKNPLLMEARKVLLNQVTLGKNDHLVTVNEFRFQLWGAADGEGSLRTWGVSHREYKYKQNSKLSNKQVIFKVAKRFGNMGRVIDFQSEPDAVGCLVRTYIFYPVVLAFHEKDGELELAAFTPRCLVSGLTNWIVARKFEKSMDDMIERDREGESTFKERLRLRAEEAEERRKEKKEAKLKKKEAAKALRAGKASAIKNEKPEEEDYSDILEEFKKVSEDLAEDETDENE